jgi:hypothetical protein
MALVGKIPVITPGEETSENGIVVFYYTLR